MKKFLAVFLLLLFSQSAHANSFSIELEYWIQKSTPNIKAKAKQFGLYKANEPLKLSETPIINLNFGLTNRNFLRTNFEWITYDYDKREDKFVDIFLVNSKIKANLTISRFLFGWRYDLLKSKYFEIGPTIDMKFMWLKYTLTACDYKVYGISVGKLIPNISEKDEILIFLPSVGARISIPILSTRLNMEFSGSNIGSYSGFDFKISLSVPIFKHLNLKGGYKLMYLTLDHKKIEGSFLSHGALMGIELVF